MTAAPPQVLTAWSREDGAARAAALYRATFGAEPAGVWSAPGRVNLIGEHTDYNGGLCLPVALPHRTYVALGRGPGGEDPAGTDAAASGMRLVSGQEDGVREVAAADLAAGRAAGWPAYVAGVVWALRAEGLVPDDAAWLRGSGPLCVAVESCVPPGAGLSSSAALECATAVGLDDLAGTGLGASDDGRARLAAACVRAENEVAGAPTGGLDQAASLRSAPGEALLLDFRPGPWPGPAASARGVPCPLAAAGVSVLVIDTRAPHRLADGQYGERRATCEAAAELLGVATLRDVPLAGLDAALAALPDDVTRRRVRHVVTEIDRTRRCVAELEALGGALGGGSGSAAATGDAEVEAVLARVGELFDASHASLRDDYEVTVPELDVAVAAARRAGALGARMTGGGFGGSAIALVRAGSEAQVAQAVVDAFAAHGFGAPAFLVADPSAPAGRDR